MGSSQNVFAWGLVDVWRRPKPEYYLTRKAYSPIRLDEKPVANPGSGKALALPIKNWFDHTNLSEVQVTWTVGGESGTMGGPDVQPHGEGMLTLPPRQWKQAEVVNIKFRGPDGLLVDEYNIVIDPPAITLAGPVGPAPRISDSAEQTVIQGTDFSISIDKKVGSISAGTYKGSLLLKGGPYLNIIGATLSNWSLKQISATTQGSEAVVSIAGTYNTTPESAGGRGGRGGRGGPTTAPPATNPSVTEVRFELRIDGQGTLVTRYTLDKFDIEPPATRVVPWNGTNAGGYQEVGVSYLITGAVDRLAWHRKGLWSSYPADHIARNRGIAVRKGQTPQVNIKPDWSWSLDETPAGVGTNDFRSQKEHIYFASALVSSSKVGVRAESDGSDAVRVELVDPSQPNSDVRMHINNQWNYRNLGLGNYMKPPVILRSGYSNSVRLRMTEAADAGAIE
jgi:hypothetical protein